MAELLIHLPDAACNTLRHAAAARGQTIDLLIEASLEIAGILPTSEARRMVESARAHARLSEDEALALAVEETRAVRGGR